MNGKKYIRVDIRSEADLPSKEKEDKQISVKRFVFTEEGNIHTARYDFKNKQWFTSDFAVLSSVVGYLIEESQEDSVRSGFDIEGLREHLKETPIEQLQKEWDEIVKLYPSVPLQSNPSPVISDEDIMVYIKMHSTNKLPNTNTLVLTSSQIIQFAKAMRDGIIKPKAE